MGAKASRPEGEAPVSVAGDVGRRTDAWRSLSWEVGDAYADLACAWADLCADPQEAVKLAVALVRDPDPIVLVGTIAHRVSPFPPRAARRSTSAITTSRSW